MSQSNDGFRPFHETIIPVIQCASSRELEFLAPLIKATKIPKDHYAIVTAWRRRIAEMGWGDQDLGVCDSLLLQKKQVETEAVSEIHRGDVQTFLRPIYAKLDEEQEKVIRQELEEKGFNIERQQDYLTGYCHCLLRLRYLVASHEL